MLLLILFLTLSKISCEFISEDVQVKLKEAFCDIKCTSNKIIEKNCSCSNLTTKLKKSEEIDNIIQVHWLCRDEKILGFRWTSNFSLAYVVEYKTYNSNWIYQNWTRKTFIVLKNLTKNHEYQIRVTGVSADSYVYGPFLSDTVKTLGSDNYPLQSPEFDNVQWELTANTTYNAIITWKPAKDRLCYYKIILLPEGGRMYLHNINNIEKLFTTNVSGFTMEKTYSVSLTSISYDSFRESPQIELTLRSPTCLETLQNLIDCAPPSPDNVSVTEEISKYYESNFENLTYDVNVVWPTPEYIPDYYTVDILLVGDNSPEIIEKVSGNETNVMFYNVTLTSYYNVRMIAYSEGGNSTPVAFSRVLTPKIHMIPSPNAYEHSENIIIIFSTLGALLIIAIVVAGIYYYRFKILKSSERPAEYYPHDKEDSSSYAKTAIYYLSDDIADDEWKILADDIEIQELLGEGAFGVVYKGIQTKTLGTGNAIKENIAIKMLKGDSSMVEIRQFEKEIEIMKSVGSHPHIVSLIGCCSKSGYWGPLLIVEYCEKGDLLSHLHALWTAVTATKYNENYVNSINTDFYNKSYDLQNDQFIQVPKNLLTYARQIAMGMEYLSNRRVVHRDLATRNVLIRDNGWVKVADFGLSRDVYQDSIYTKTGMGRLPMKWMAIESLTHQLYTSQSDVWSFGVVLWEIATLGKSPYLTIDQVDFLKFLLNGNRLECPKNCGTRLYQIMMLCWKENPLERPTFSTLLKIIENLLETENDYLTLDI